MENYKLSREPIETDYTETFVINRGGLESLIESIWKTGQKLELTIMPSGNQERRMTGHDARMLNKIYGIAIKFEGQIIFGYSLVDYYFVTLIFSPTTSKIGSCFGFSKYGYVISLTAEYVGHNKNASRFCESWDPLSLHQNGDRLSSSPYKCKTPSCRLCETEKKATKLPWFGWGGYLIEHSSRFCIPYESHLEEGEVDDHTKLFRLELKTNKLEQYLAAAQDKIIVLTEMVDNLQTKHNEVRTN